MSGVIVGVDDSATARVAARRAATIAHAIGEPLHFVMSVKRGSSVAVRSGIDRFRHDWVEHASAVLDSIKSDVGAPEATTAIGGTDPSGAICDEARRLDASMVVVGNRRVQGATRFLGSVATDVLRDAPCDVLVVDTRVAAEHHTGVASAAIFRACAPVERERIDQLSTSISVNAGRVLTEQGRPGREFGVLLDGTATVTIDGATVATLGPGDHYGEMALLAAVGAPVGRTATVTADGDQTVAVMSAQEFTALVSEFPAVRNRISESAAARIG